MYYVVRLDNMWLCFVWNILIFSLVWEDFSLAMFEVSLIFHHIFFTDLPFITSVMR